MASAFEPPQYRRRRDILESHGIVVLVLYLVFRALSYLSFTRCLAELPRKIARLHLGFDNWFDKVKPWWQDIPLLVLFFVGTPVARLLTWSRSSLISCLGIAGSSYILLDVLTFHARVLWFDDLIPNISNSRRLVWSHRRIFFLAILGFLQSIALFSFIYHIISPLQSISWNSLLERSFSTATLFDLPRELTLLDPVQVLVSFFYIAIVIAATVSSAYRRGEIAPPRKDP